MPARVIRRNAGRCPSTLDAVTEPPEWVRRLDLAPHPEGGWFRETWRSELTLDESALPDVSARYHQAEKAAAYLTSHGYERIGIDHFALPSDPMAIAAREGTLRRNFQGYTVDPADALIGLGASSIGSLPQGYVQNNTATARYIWAVESGGVATEKGVILSEEDKLRRRVIEQLMCDLTFSRTALGALGEWDAVRSAISDEAKEIVANDRDGFIVETADGFRVTEQGRPFLRTIAARFDAYLAANKARHSIAV